MEYAPRLGRYSINCSLMAPSSAPTLCSLAKMSTTTCHLRPWAAMLGCEVLRAKLRLISRLAAAGHCHLPDKSLQDTFPCLPSSRVRFLRVMLVQLCSCHATTFKVSFTKCILVLNFCLQSASGSVSARMVLGSFYSNSTSTPRLARLTFVSAISLSWSSSSGCS